MGKKKKSNLELTPLEMVNLWNTIGDMISVNQGDPAFTVAAKRLQYAISDYVKFWNDLSVKEREIIVDQKVTVDCKMIEKLPEHYPRAKTDLLSLVFEKVPKPDNKLAKLIKDAQSTA